MAQIKPAWTRLALADLQNAHEYIARERPSAAAHIVERIGQAVDAALLHPHAGRPGRVEGTRELVVPGTPFIIPYRLKQGRLEVLAVIHAARRWPEAF